MEYIKELLKQYADDFQVIDEQCILKIIDHVLDNNKLIKNNLNDVYFTSNYINNNEIWYGKPVTDFNNNNLVFDIDAIIDYNLKTNQRVILELNTKEKIFFQNISVIENVFNQIEKLIQYNHLNENKVESKLVSISKYKPVSDFEVSKNINSNYEKYMILFDNEYEKAIFYKLNPANRLANIKSHKLSLMISNDIVNDRCTILKDLMYYRYLKEQLYGYYHTLYEPLKTFIEYKRVLQYNSNLDIVNYDEIELLNNQNYSLNKRLLYGMKLAPKELDRQNTLLKSTKSYQLLKK